MRVLIGVFRAAAAVVALSLSAIDPAAAQTTTATVPAGTNPSGVAVNPVTNKVYVANNGSSSVTVIDGETNTTTTVNVGTNPRAVAVERPRGSLATPKVCRDGLPATRSRSRLRGS